MASTSIDVVVRTQGQEKIEKLGRDSTAAERAVDKLVDTSGSARRAIDDLGRSSGSAAGKIAATGRAAEGASGGVNRLAGSVRNLAGAYLGIEGIKFVFGKTAELETQTRSIQVLTGSLEQTQKIIGEIQQFASATPFTSAEVIAATKTLLAFNVPAEKSVEITKRLGDIAGATGADLQDLGRIYGQVTSRNRLDTESLNQLLERGVGIQAELQGMYKLSGEEFRDALEKGRISGEAFEVAIQNLTNTGGKYADGAIAQSDTLAGKFSTLTDGVESVARTIGSILSPAIKSVLNLGIDAVNQINALLETGKLIGDLGVSDQTRASLFNKVDADAQKLAKLRFDGGRSGRFDSGEFARVKEQLFKDELRRYGYANGLLTPPKPSVAQGLSTAPPLSEGTGNGKGSGTSAADRAADTARREAERAAEIEKAALGRLRTTELETAELEQQSVLRGLINDAQIAGDKELETRLQGEQKILQIGYDLQKALDSEEDSRVDLALEVKAQAAALAAQQDTEDALAKLEGDRLTTYVELLNTLNEQLLLAGALTEEERQRLEVEFQINKLKKDGVLTSEAEVKLIRDANKAVRDRQTATDKLKDQQQQITDLINQAGTTAYGAIERSIDNIINKTESWKDILSDTFSQFGKLLMGAGLQMLGGTDGVGLFSILAGTFTGGRAGGGPVSAGQPYLVGERGPELMVPSSNGGVLSNEELRAGMRGSSRGGSRQVNITTGPVMRFKDEDYVPVADLPRIINEAAAKGGKQGEQRAMARLQNSPRTRSRLGIR